MPILTSIAPVPYRTAPLERGLVGDVWQKWLTTIIVALNASLVRGTFANNVAALAGGLVVGQIYQTAAGELRIVV